MAIKHPTRHVLADWGGGDTSVSVWEHTDSTDEYLMVRYYTFADHEWVDVAGRPEFVNRPIDAYIEEVNGFDKANGSFGREVTAAEILGL